MKQLKTSTGTVRLLDFSTYYGTCYSENFFDSYTIDDDFKNGDCEYTAEEAWDNWDNNKYMDELVRLATKFVKYEIEPAVVGLNIGIQSIVVDGYWSPREYNFYTDTLNFTLNVDDEFQQTVVNIINSLDGVVLDSYKQYLKDRCTSRSGFVSFVSNSIPDIIDAIIEDGDCGEMQAFLDWYIKYTLVDLYDEEDIYHTTINRAWSEYLHENLYSVGEFLVDGFVGKKAALRELEADVKDVAEYMYANHTEDEVVQHILTTFEVGDMISESDIHTTVTKTVNDTFLKINNNTLNIFANEEV